MCDTITIKGEEGESMKPIKLKELIATAKDPATQQIAIAENYTLYVVPLFEGLQRLVTWHIVMLCDKEEKEL